MTDWTDVVSLSDFPDGSKIAVDADGTEIAVFNLGGEIYAIEDVCNHDGACMIGEDGEGEVENGEVICPRHGARFDIRSGKVLCAPAYEDVDTFPTRIEAGIIQVRDDRWD